MRFRKKELTEDQKKRLKERVLDGLEFHLGIVSYALEDAMVSKSSFDEWFKEDDGFRAAVLDIKEMTLDFVERQLVFNIKEGNQRAIEFYLSKKGKSRGYGNDFAEGLQEDQKVLGWVVTPVKSNPVPLEENTKNNETDN